MSTMDTLNDEILMEIFKWLPGRSRRDSVRLVCQRWNQLTQTHTFTKEESIVFANGYDIRSVIPFFALDQRRVLHLRFIGQTILGDNFENSFWQSYGGRVESIEFHDTIFSLIDLKNILQYCPKLKCIKMLIHNIWHLLQNFNAFVDLKFTAVSVTTFHFHVDGRLNTLEDLTDYKMDKILAMFPNLTSLELDILSSCGLYFQVYDYDDPQLIVELSDDMMSIFGILYSLFGVAKNLRKFCLEAPWLCRIVGVQELEDLSIFLSKLHNVSELKLCGFPFMEINLRQPQNPLLNLTKITSVHLEMPGFRHSTNVTEFLLHILHDFTNLRSLHLSRINSIEVDEQLIEKLLASALKVLYLGFARLNIDDTVKQCHGFSINRTLKTLTACRYFRTEDFAFTLLLSVLLKYFQGIQDLKLINANDEILQNITLKHQKCLKKLQIQSQFIFTDTGFIGVRDSVHAKGEENSYFMSNLPNLEFLRISPAHGITEKTFATFVLPKLRTFELLELEPEQLSKNSSPHSMPYLAKLECLIENSPGLKELRLILQKPMLQQELEKVLSSFKCLRYVSITFKSRPYVNVNNKYRVSINNRQLKTDDKSMVYNYEIFFELCPSLRKFVHNDVWFYINTLTKKLDSRPYPRIMTPLDYLME